MRVPCVCNAQRAFNGHIYVGSARQNFPPCPDMTDFAAHEIGTEGYGICTRFPVEWPQRL
jgi:hypothetical protein